jgi:hypothetical protein
VLHEFLAILRFDALWTLIARVVQCVYFANPLAWWAFRRYREATEDVGDRWSVYALGNAVEYATDLAAVGERAGRGGLMGLEVPMVQSRARARERAGRSLARGVYRPGVIGRRALTTAVVGWLMLLTLLGCLQFSEPRSSTRPVVLNRAAGATGAGLAGVTGAVLLTAAERGRRRKPGETAVERAQGDAPGAYRQTVAVCVRRIEREWEDVQLALGVVMRVLVPLLFVLMMIAILVVLGERLAEPEPFPEFIDV